MAARFLLADPSPQVFASDHLVLPLAWQSKALIGRLFNLPRVRRKWNRSSAADVCLPPAA